MRFLPAPCPVVAKMPDFLLLSCNHVKSLLLNNLREEKSPLREKSAILIPPLSPNGLAIQPERSRHRASIASPIDHHFAPVRP